MNEKRMRKENEIRDKMQFCLELVEVLIEDFENGCYEQAKGYFDSWNGINYKTRYQADVRRIRRELLKLHNMLAGG